MRLRKLAAGLALAATALTCLSACTSKIGQAASVGGDRISDSDVNSYLTAKAVPFQLPPDPNTGAVTTIIPKPYVLGALISAQLVEQTLRAKGGMPTNKQISTQIYDDTQGASKAAREQAYTESGFTARFAELDDRRVALLDLLGARTKAATQADVVSVIAAQKIPVDISGRYGTWDLAQLTVLAAIAEGAPKFVTFAPAPTLTTPSASPSAAPAG